MKDIGRRELLGAAAAAVGAAMVRSSFGADTQPAAASQPTPGTKPFPGVRPKASDMVTLGKTGIRTSRLSIGTGTLSGSVQRKLGTDGMVRLLRHGLDQGVRWWDAADSYKSHPYLQATLKQVKRDQVVITSKTSSKTAEGISKDIERFRQEMGTDYIDIVLLHCLQDANWREKMKGPMDALSEAKAKGWVRAVGCSCHTLTALKAAADEPWVEVDLARFNPYAAVMDVGKPDDVPQVEQVLKTMHERGKAVYGMKIVGEGRLAGDQIQNSVRFVLSKPYVSAFTVGFANEEQLDDMIRRIERADMGA
jgi:1-deoxyxylulose-5-phosphate synthase